MRTSKKVASTLLAFGMAFFLAVNVGFAQEQTAKAADATEAVSPAKEAKSTIGVPAQLVKAMDDAKTKGSKEARKNTSVKSKVTQDPDVWYFNGENLADATDASNWTKTPDPNCGSGDALPCELSVMNAPDQAALQTFLNGKTAEEIRDDFASSTKEAN